LCNPLWMNSSDFFFFFLCFLSNSSRMHYSWILQEFISKFYLCNHSEAMLNLCNPSRMHYSWILQEFITKVSFYKQSFRNLMKNWIFKLFRETIHNHINILCNPSLMHHHYWILQKFLENKNINYLYNPSGIYQYRILQEFIENKMEFLKFLFFFLI